MRLREAFLCKLGQKLSVAGPRCRQGQGQGQGQGHGAQGTGHGARARRTGEGLDFRPSSVPPGRISIPRRVPRPLVSLVVTPGGRSVPQAGGHFIPGVELPTSLGLFAVSPADLERSPRFVLPEQEGYPPTSQLMATKLKTNNLIA